MGMAEAFREARRLVSAGWSLLYPVYFEGEQPMWCLRTDPRAVAFDLESAVYLAASRHAADAIEMGEILDGAAPGGFFRLWHDKPGRTQAEVVALIDKARARAERIQAAA